jgi:hypothetical protein
MRKGFKNKRKYVRSDKENLFGLSGASSISIIFEDDAVALADCLSRVVFGVATGRDSVFSLGGADFLGEVVYNRKSDSRLMYEIQDAPSWAFWEQAPSSQWSRKSSVEHADRAKKSRESANITMKEKGVTHPDFRRRRFFEGLGDSLVLRSGVASALFRTLVRELLVFVGIVDGHDL